MSMQPSATRAPGTIWWARLGETPGSSASSSGAIATSLGIHSRSSSSGSVRGTRVPSAEGAAPQMRASERNVFEVAAARSGGPPRSRWPASWAISARISRRSACTVSSSAVPSREVRAGQPGGAQRQRPGHVGGLVRAAGDLERAAADVEDREPTGRPAEPAAYGEEGQPGLVLAGEHVDHHAGALLHVLEDLLAVAGVAHRGGREAEDVLAPLVLGHPQRLGGERGQRVDPGLGDVTAVVEVLGQPQRLLEGVRRQRCGAAVGVHHEQVSGVGADVQHAHAHLPHRTLRWASCARKAHASAGTPGTHGSNVPAQPWPRSLDQCPRSTWCSPARSSSSRTPTTSRR